MRERYDKGAIDGLPSQRIHIKQRQSNTEEYTECETKMNEHTLL